MASIKGGNHQGKFGGKLSNGSKAGAQPKPIGHKFAK